ncbi:C39 family peptidase [Lachnospiraceae bacterium 45-P1]
MKRKKKKQPTLYSLLQHILTTGIVLSSLSLCISILWANPGLLSQAASLPKELFARLEQATADTEDESNASSPEPSSVSPEPVAAEEAPQRDLEELISSGEIGEIEDFDTSLTEMEENTYYYIMDSAMGPMIYYNQGDSRWADYLYGGADPIRSHGCGPTAVAMVISSFSSVTLTPPEAADWAAANGYYAPDHGSYHSLIADSLTAFGLNVQSVKDRSQEHVSDLLREGSVLIALMGKGSLTQNGHFIVITKLLENGNVYIADPGSYANSTKEWELSKLLSELKGSRDSGAPLWAVSPPA